MRIGIILAVTLLGVAGCSQRGLMDLRTTSEGPDEFLILPNKPLEIPDNLAALPQPMPGGVNRVDQNPLADAVAAMGGRPSALDATAVPASDGALVAQTSRYGVPGNIRETLAEQDAEFRRRQARGTRIRIFPVDRYKQAYRRELNDPFQENQRLRASGVQTPTSPPPNRQ